jgi:hypothetical protein
MKMMQGERQTPLLVRWLLMFQDTSKQKRLTLVGACLACLVLLCCVCIAVL